MDSRCISAGVRVNQEVTVIGYDMHGAWILRRKGAVADV
jgi:hypothetical protein